MTPSAGTITVVRAGSDLACSTAAEASRMSGLSFPCGPRTWRAPFWLGFRLAHLGLGDVFDFLDDQVLPHLPNRRPSSQAPPWSDGLLDDVFAFGLRLDQPLLRRSYCLRSRADGLSNAGQTRVDFYKRDIVGLRVNPKRCSPASTFRVWANQHLLNSSSNLRRHADNQCLDRRLRCPASRSITSMME